MIPEGTKKERKKGWRKGSIAWRQGKEIQEMRRKTFNNPSTVQDSICM